MGSVIAVLKETPIPTILVVAGIVFLLLSIAGQLAGRINVPPERQRWAAIMGGFLLAAGIVLHVIPQARLTPPEPKQGPTSPTSMPAPEKQSPQTSDRTPGTQQPTSIPDSSVQALTEEKEPNDSITAATSITEGTTVRGLIATNQDRDWFTFRASSFKTRVIVRKQATMEVDVYDHVEKKVASQAASRDTSITLSFKSTPESTYYIVVKPFVSQGSDYELTVRKE